MTSANKITCHHPSTKSNKFIQKQKHLHSHSTSVSHHTLINQKRKKEKTRQDKSQKKHPQRLLRKRQACFRRATQRLTRVKQTYPKREICAQPQQDALKALSKCSRSISAKTLLEKHKSRLRSKASRENTRENRSRFRFRGKRYPHNKRPRTQSKKAKDKSSHKRYLHKDISTKTSPQMASSCSTEPHNHSQGSNKFIQKGKYMHSHNKTLSSRSRHPLIDFSSAKSTKRINCKKKTKRKRSAQPQPFPNRAEYLAQPQSKTFSKRSQGTFNKRSKCSRPTSACDTKRQVKISIQSRQREYKRRIGVGLGLGASSLSGRVAQETQSTQRQAPQMPNPPP